MAKVEVPDEPPLLSISLEKVCFVVVMAREFDVEEEETDSESDPSEERAAPLLVEEDQNPIEEELVEFINDMSVDEQIDLVAIAWLGRGDGSIADWDDLRQQATDAHSEHTATYLLGMPLLPDYLSEGLAAFGYSCEESEHF